MRLNHASRRSVLTHEGARAFRHLSAEAELRRSLMACLLWEDQFYEDGKAIAERIVETAAKISPDKLAAIAIEAREAQNLRHAPLIIPDVLSKTGRGRAIVADTVERVVKRPDEMTELLAVYWRNGRKMIPAQMRKGLARAFAKFDAYQLAKYDRDGDVKLRDVLRMVRPKPVDEAQSALWAKVKDRTLPPPDTWEVALSAGADKREAFERLLRAGKLGYLALLRNLRNMAEARVDEELVRDAILARKGAERVLPFRYVAAARAAPQFEQPLDEALAKAIAKLPRFAGKTIMLVDVSGSMEAPLSRKSDMTRMDAAATLAAVINGDLRIFSFSNEVVEVPARRGMAGIDAIKASQTSGATFLGKAVQQLNGLAHDRLIVVTDEQSHDQVPDPVAQHAYMINVASYKHGVGYGRWTHIDGFSEGVIRFMHEHEANDG